MPSGDDAPRRREVDLAETGLMIFGAYHVLTQLGDRLEMPESAAIAVGVGFCAKAGYHICGKAGEGVTRFIKPGKLTGMFFASAMAVAGSLQAIHYTTEFTTDYFTPEDEKQQSTEQADKAPNDTHDAISALGADRARNPETGRHYRLTVPRPA